MNAIQPIVFKIYFCFSILKLLIINLYGNPAGTLGHPQQILGASSHQICYAFQCVFCCVCCVAYFVTPHQIKCWEVLCSVISRPTCCQHGLQSSSGKRLLSPSPIIDPKLCVRMSLVLPPPNILILRSKFPRRRQPPPHPPKLYTHKLWTRVQNWKRSKPGPLSNCIMLL